MPYLVRERLFIGNISDAAKILCHGNTEITHLLSLLSSSSISFFREWKPSLEIPTKEIRKVYDGSSRRDSSVSGSPLSSDDEGTEEKSEEKSNPGEKLLYSVELAGLDLKFVRMAVPLRDMESENLLDYLEACLDFIEESRAKGSILVHCFAGVSRSAAVVTAYLMRTEQLSQEDALESLRQSCPEVCPNDGFLEQLKMFELMGFKVDPASSIYKRFRLTILGFFLNPRFQYEEGFLYSDNIRSGVTKVIERLAPDVTFAIEATREVAQFRGKIGRFGDLTAQTAVGIMNPGFFLNPRFQYQEGFEYSDSIRSGVTKVIERLAPNVTFAIEATREIAQFRGKIGRFGDLTAQTAVGIMNPGDEYNKGAKIDNSKFGADPGSPPEIVSSEASVDGEKPKPAYRCKKCRRVVALQHNVIDHIPGEGETCFGWQKRRSCNPYRESDEPECSSVFVEPLRWMKTVEEGSMEGKLSCIHCEARLGYFNWSGIQCSCGSWITPAFQLHKGRVDISTA